MRRFVLFAALALVAAPALAQFDTGYVVSDVDLRAGPDIGYPLIDVEPAGGPVYINGCTEAYEWCDVVFQDEHGWIDGNDIQFDYDNRPVYLPGYGAAIGTPIIGFSIGTYWNRWYGNRPFYRERSHWYRYSPPRRPPFRSASRGGNHYGEHRHPGYRHAPTRGYCELRQDHRPRPQQNDPQRHQQRPPRHQIPREARRPTAGPVRAVPLNRGAYRTAPAPDRDHSNHRRGGADQHRDSKCDRGH